jgi:hypothetical protein
VDSIKNPFTQPHALASNYLDLHKNKTQRNSNIKRGNRENFKEHLPQSD